MDKKKHSAWHQVHFDNNRNFLNKSMEVCVGVTLFFFFIRRLGPSIYCLPPPPQKNIRNIKHPPPPPKKMKL